MTRRIRLLEEDLEQSSGRLTDTSSKLDDASKAAEESERYALFYLSTYFTASLAHVQHALSLHAYSARMRLNNQQGADEMKINELERTIATATMATQEAEWKYEEVYYLHFAPVIKSEQKSNNSTIWLQ